MSTNDVYAMEFQRKIKVEMRHGLDLSDRLYDAGKIIKYVYDNNTRGNRPKLLPDDLRICSLCEASISGILWYVGRKNRPKIMPEPFFIAFGSCCYYDPDQKATLYAEENRLWLPAPVEPDVPPDATLRWIVISKHTLVYYFKIKVKVCPVIHSSDDNKPFNINQIPNLGIANSDD
jgi:hypothetical protein